MHARQVEYVYAKYSPAFFDAIFRIIVEIDIVEEGFHIAFVKIIKKCTPATSKGRIYMWISTTCRNAAMCKTLSKEFSEKRKTNMIDDYVHGSEGHSATRRRETFSQIWIAW